MHKKLESALLLHAVYNQTKCQKTNTEFAAIVVMNSEYSAVLAQTLMGHAPRLGVPKGA